MKPFFNLVTVDHHLTRRVKNRDAREAKCMWIVPMGYFINLYKAERTIVLN